MFEPTRGYCRRCRVLPSENGSIYCSACWCHDCKTNAKANDHDKLCGMCQHRKPPGYFNDYLEEEGRNPKFEGEEGRVFGGPYDRMTPSQVEIAKTRIPRPKRTPKERKGATAAAARASVATQDAYGGHLASGMAAGPLERIDLTDQVTRLLQKSQPTESEVTAASGSGSGGGSQGHTVPKGPRSDSHNARRLFHDDSEIETTLSAISKLSVADRDRLDSHDER